MDNRNYIYEYYQEIKNGNIIVGKWIDLIIGKIVEELKDGIILFNAEYSNDAIDWIETNCRHTEGPLATQLFKLQLWQKAFISALFGITDTNGKRLYREAVLIVSRKNGKSLLASAIMNYVWRKYGGFGARCYCTAPKLDQADLVYSCIWNMVLLDPEYQELKEEIRTTRDTHNVRMISDDILPKHRQSDLYIASMNSIVKKQAFSERKSDGFNPSAVICDEISSWQGDKGLKQYEVWKSSLGAREMGDNPPFILSCSTSGYINDSIYDELIKRATRFLLGDSKEKRLLPFLYMIDDIEKWNDINELRKSNPNLGVSVSVDYLLEEIAVAEGSLSKKSEFIVKYCNIKQNSSQAWLNATDVENATSNIADFTLEDFRGSYCVGGIDLSRTTDLTACCVVIEKNKQLYVFSKFFLPEERIDEATARDNVPYRQYIEKGFLQPSGDNFVNYRDCYDWFTSLVTEYEILPLKVGYDRYSAQYLIQDLSTFGFHCDDVYQGNNLYPVLMEFEGLLKDGVVHLGNNDLLKIHLLNSAIKMDVEQNKGRLVKINANEHIDGMAALIDAMTVRQKWYGEIGGQLAN